ncbi:MauE/DoxX family redox-associated membrane protein [Chitinophaga sp. YIM B06452]|uniref:MauE/DoxX family redox-associated membrane protein n=1 Tax=Chitinophaga sp. YIM B06452 TaxID=3082158 RepID=UPI0031FE4E48
MAQKSVTLNPQYPRKSKWKNIFIEAVNAILIITWLHTGISKLITHVAFYIQMQQSPLFYKNALVVSYAAPILEIIIAALLIVKKTRFIGFLSSFILMAFFTFYVVYLMVNVPSLPCSCGGVVSWMNWPQHLVFNILLTGLSFVASILYRKKIKQESIL